MAERVIPLVDLRRADLAALVPLHPSQATGSLVDTLGRPLRDLRIKKKKKRIYILVNYW